MIAFIPRREKRSGSIGVHLTVFPFCISLVNRNWFFRNRGDNPPFLESRKPLSPEGMCFSTPDVVQLIFLLVSKPRTKLRFQFVTGNPPNFFCRLPLSCGWMDRWVGGWTENQKCPSIFFSLKYVTNLLYYS